ncbi:MAG: carboxypeptidase-like regulatory domain-containing protein [Bacteroidota bacterium]|nr:carboxypeptidase-like regulatory domain-containing protein [Bacteroidota bacterium]
MKNISLLGIFVLFSLIIRAEEIKSSISGKVIDQSTLQPLPGVNVIILDTNLGAATDINGEYKIENIPPGRYTLRASFIGYVTQVNSEVIISPAHSEIVDFELRPSALLLEATHQPYTSYTAEAGGFNRNVQVTVPSPSPQSIEGGDDVRYGLIATFGLFISTSI